MNHPSEEDLAAVLREGMLPQETERILLHLDTCKVCERRLEELEPLLGRYRELRTANLPESPVWGDITQRMDERKRIPKPAWMGTLAAAAALCALFLWPTGKQAELRAETLLKEAEKSAPPKRRLEVRTAAGSFVRPAVLIGSASDAVGSRFEKAHYDWNDPLGAASYGKWRDGLKAKKVKVTENSGQAKIETDTSEGELVGASLTIAENNMTVVAGRFEFADREWVEIAAIPDVTEPPKINMTLKAAPDATARFVQTLPERELHVWAAIDQLNLGAGAPINIEAASGERILVTAYRLEPDKEQQLRANLAKIEGVTLEVADDSGAAARPVDSAINLSESIVARAHLLDRLANRFPESTAESFGVADRHTLWEMRVRYASLMNKDIDALGKKLSITPRRMPVSAPPAQALVESATLVDRLVTDLLSNSPSDHLTEEFSRLRQLSLDYAQSLGAEPSR
jgi:hypothetical protein